MVQNVPFTFGRNIEHGSKIPQEIFNMYMKKC